MLPQAPLSLPIMLCSSSKSDATWLCGALPCTFFLPGQHCRISYDHSLFEFYIAFYFEWKWKGFSGRVHYYHFAIHNLPTLVLFHHVGSKLLLHVNWSACNPHYRIQRQLYVLPFTKAHWSPHVLALWENHSCRQSIMVNLQANHAPQLFIHTVE